jgi:hypothetical protein
MALRHELALAQPPDQAEIEPDDGAFHVFGGVRDVEGTDTGDEIRQLRHRFGVGVDDLARLARRTRSGNARGLDAWKLTDTGHLAFEELGFAQHRCRGRRRGHRAGLPLARLRWRTAREATKRLVRQGRACFRRRIDSRCSRAHRPDPVDVIKSACAAEGNVVELSAAFHALSPCRVQCP